MKNEQYQELFELALKGEGKLLKGFSNFHQYSWLNQLWAMSQMIGRDIPVGPIATFKKWQSLGRNVKKGSKALALLMPVTIKDKETDEKKTLFLPKNNWFCLHQTEGDDVEFPAVEFDFEKALETLKITKEVFDHVDGNVLGYAKKGRVLAINPVGERPEGTFFHEVGHILLGHCDGDSELVDSVTTQKNLKEVEAEGVALCCSLALGLAGTEYHVGYVRNWWKHNEIPADSIKKIFRVTNEILRAGQTKEVAGEKEASASA
jgi:antirestriction protein ArdC